MVSVNSQWYPYQKVQESYYDLSDTVTIPRKLCDYLIDAPQGDYTPADDNTHARCRLWKYLYYDGADPLSETLPTIAQKMQVVFDPSSPTQAPSDKGYRLFPLAYVKQSQTTGQTRIYVRMGRTVPSNDEFKMCLAVTFSIWTSYLYENNTKSDEYSRCFAIEQALIEALHGVNMAGVGTFFFAKSKHPDCGSNSVFDGNTNVGRELTIALEIATTAPRTIADTDNMPLAFSDSNIRLA